MRPGKFPVLYTCAMHNKDLQRVEIAESLKVGQPAWSTQWYGVIEGGDTKRFVANGYVHVIGQVRGGHKSEGQLGVGDEWDHYDMIEWITQQPWCDGNVGMVGISAFAAEQWRAAAQGTRRSRPSSPTTPAAATAAWRLPRPAPRRRHPDHALPHRPVQQHAHEHRHAAGAAAAASRRPWEWAMNNPDYMMYVNLYNILTLRGQRIRACSIPCSSPSSARAPSSRPRRCFKKIKIPFVTGAFEGAYTYKMHWQGAQHFFYGVDVPHKHLFVTPPAHAERPFHEWHDEIIRWYDHWLKGIDNGVEDDPPVKIWVMGENKWRTFDDWPVPETAVDQVLPAQLGEAEHQGPPAGRRRPTSTSRRTPSCRCRPRRPRRSSGSAT